MMRPKDIAKSGTEHAIQSALFCWANCAMNHGFEAADIWAEGGLLPIRDESLGPAIPALKWLHAVPNGGSRGDTEKTRKKRGGELKAEGVKTGVADIFWPLPMKAGEGMHRTLVYCGLMIEMKRPGQKPTLDQVEYGTFVTGQGYYWAVCDDWRQAADLIQMYFWGKL